MAYQGIDSWEAVLAPALTARVFEPEVADFDEDWVQTGGLQPWDDDEPEPQQVEIDKPRIEPVMPKAAPAFNFVLPNDPDPGRQQADRNAAMKGVNPGRQGGGQGHLFDLARTFLKTPYVFGASGPEAFDCSGFVKYLFERVYGVELPHSAAQQSSHTKKIGRDQLQPGDLIFYSYGRLGKGAIDHVEVYMGDNKQIGTSNPSEDLDIDDVDWDNVAVLGRVPGAGGAGRAVRNTNVTDPLGKKPKAGVKQVPAPQDRTLVPSMLTSSENALSNVLIGALTEDTIAVRTQKTPQYKGPKGWVKSQLYRGFLDAGREDLARMVSTKDFREWIEQESGWQVDVTSPANNNGKANDGLFQVWRGHDFNGNGQVARMSPYEQAKLIAKYFSHLTPDAIRSYAEQIRSGTYHGWG